MSSHFTRVLLAGWIVLGAAAAQAQVSGLIGDHPVSGWPQELHQARDPNVRLTSATVQLADELVSPETLAAPPPPAVLGEQPPLMDPIVTGPEGAIDGSLGLNNGLMPGVSADYGYGYGACPGGLAASCPDVYFVQAELLYMDRARSGRPVISTGGNLPSLDWEHGYRLTVGEKFDCTDGWEAVFTGPFEWEEAVIATGTDLGVYFNPWLIDASAFADGVYHAQSYNSKFNSLEFSQKCWAWDVLTQVWGMRYLQLDDEYSMYSLNDVGQAGLLDVRTRNRFIGMQYGFDILYPYYRRWVFGAKAKLGLYGNIAEGNSSLINDGEVQFDNSSEEFQIGFNGEFGVHAAFKILPRVTATAGYEFWYLYGAALAWEQELYYLNPFSGSSLDTDEDVFYHGATAGVEVVW
jgi:hypothetical protein